MKPIALWAPCLALALASCTTVDVKMAADCSMRVPMNSSGISASGDIRLKWKVVQKDELSGYCAGAKNTYGCAYVHDGFTQIYVTESLEFSEVCKLARLGHEVAHSMYANH